MTKIEQLPQFSPKECKDDAFYVRANEDSTITVELKKQTLSIDEAFILWCALRDTIQHQQNTNRRLPKNKRNYL